MIGFEGHFGAMVAAIACLAAAGWSLIATRDLRSPPVIVGLAWGGTLSIYAASGSLVPSISFGTVLMLSSGPWLFAAASRLAPDAPSPSTGREVAPAAPRWVGDLLLVAAAVGLPLIVLRMLEVGESGPTGNVLVNVRLADTEGEDPLGALAYLVNFGIFAAGIHVLEIVVTSWWRKGLMVALAVVYCVVTTGRTHFTMLLALLGGGLVISGRIRTRTFVGVFIGAFAMVFLTMGLLLGKIGEGDTGLFGDLRRSLSIYLIGGVAALNDFLKSGEPWAWGQNAGRTVVAILNRLGLAPEPRALVKEFRVVGFETNVYTVYRPYFEDFGWAGVAGIQLLAGYVSGATYARALTGSRAAAFGYGLLLYAAVMQVFQDQYFSLLSTWLQAALLLALVGFMAKPTE